MGTLETSLFGGGRDFLDNSPLMVSFFSQTQEEFLRDHPLVKYDDYVATKDKVVARIEIESDGIPSSQLAEMEPPQLKGVILALEVINWARNR